MDHAFWHDKWDSNQIGFHQAYVNPLLVKHFDALGLKQGSRVFVPLCGKTRDMGWLMRQGCHFLGAELSERAVRDLFAEMDVQPDVTQLDAVKRYSAEGIDVFVGDVFAVDQTMLGSVDAIFDRAALVALPTEMRERYARHLIAITGNASQLLITFVYDQAQMTGPPFSIPLDEVNTHYGSEYDAQALEKRDVPGGFRGNVPATETVWALSPRSV